MFYFIEDKDEAAAPQAKHKSNPLAQIAVEPMLNKQTRGGTLTFRF